MNWGESVAVRFWPLGGKNHFLFEWPVGFIATFFLAVGFVPTWLFHRGTKWRLTRRIKALEAAARIPQFAPAETPPSANPTDSPLAPSASNTAADTQA